MARLTPSLPPRTAFGAGARAELALLQTLEQGLSGATSLFHRVDWSRERLVDSTDMPHITTWTTQALGPGLPHAQMQPRVLADHMAQVAPVRATVETFHEYAVNLLRGAGEPVGFVGPGAFDQIASQAIALLAGRPADLDVLLDEVQDLQADWVQALLGRVRQSGRAYLLEDPDQQLYKDREGFDLPEAITVSSHENFRSPRALEKLINALRLTSTEIEAMGPHPGEVPDPIVFERPEGVQPCTIQAIERCLARGFALDDMAVISMRGRERSLLQSLDSLGPWTLRRFTGAFDAGGGAIWTTGELLVESLRRFKGQAAAVLTECDFAELDALNQRMLFVGLTRARVHLEWVFSASAAVCLATRLGAA